MFYIKQYIPTLEKTIFYKELTNYTYFALLKYINNSDERGIADYFNEIIETHLKIPIKLNSLEKFLILFDIRSICVGDSIELKLKSNATAKLSIFSMLENIKRHISNINFNRSYIFDDLTLNLSAPANFIVDRDDDIYENVLESVTYNNETFFISTFSTIEKADFFKSLPAKAFNFINSYINDISNKLSDVNIISRNELVGIEEMPLNIFDNTMFNLLKLLYNDDLMNFYEQQYSFIKKLQFTNDHFMKMTPNESRLFINLFNKDIKAQEEAQSKNSNSYSGPVPTFATV